MRAKTLLLVPLAVAGLLVATALAVPAGTVPPASPSTDEDDEPCGAPGAERTLDEGMLLDFRATLQVAAPPGGCVDAFVNVTGPLVFGSDATNGWFSVSVVQGSEVLGGCGLRLVAGYWATCHVQERAEGPVQLVLEGRGVGNVAARFTALAAP